MIEREVMRESAGLRLDRFLALELPEFSRSRLQALINDGCVKLNGAVPRTRELVKAGDVVRLEVPALEKIEAGPEAIAFPILFEDEDLIVIDKPAGLVVHPGAGNADGTLVNALLHHCPTLSGIGGKERPGIVHRLDKETSGCLVVAKNDAAHRELSKQFAARTLKKIYLALVAGQLQKTAGTIDAPIARHPVHRQRMAISRTIARSFGDDGVSRGASGAGDEPGGVRVAQRPHAPDSRASASPRKSGLRRQTLRGENGEEFSAADVARVAAWVHASAERRVAGIRSAVAGGFSDGAGRFGVTQLDVTRRVDAMNAFAPASRLARATGQSCSRGKQPPASADRARHTSE